MDDTQRSLDVEGWRLVAPEDIETGAESWAIHPLPDDPHWIVAIRIGPDQAGNLAATELRVFPRTDSSDFGPESVAEGPNDYGEWTREAADVPAGGIRARALRSLNLRDHQRAARETLALLARKPKERSKIEELFGQLPSHAESDVWKRAIEHISEHKESTTATRKGRRTDEYLARLAVLYEETLRSHPSRVNQALAEPLGLTVNQIRDDVHEARHRGYLSSTQPGRPGGEATQRAKQTLDRNAPRHEEAGHGKD
jgi:hypothetical protein